MPDALAALKAFGEAEKQPNLEKLLDCQAAANEATATRQAQRAGSSPADTEPVEKLAKEFAALQEAEAKLKGDLIARQARMQGPTLELERLQRGCRQVAAWIGASEPVTGCADVGDSEGAVLVLLEDAERVRAELTQQELAAKRLEQLGEHLKKHADLEYAVTEATAQLAPLPAINAAMERRIAKLNEELQRQRRLAQERQAFNGKLVVFRAYVGQATEVSDFPLPLYDTHESIAAIKEEGGKLAETLLPAPEGATAEARAEAQELLQR